MTSPVMHSKHNAKYGEIEEVRAGVDWISCSVPNERPGVTQWHAEALDAIGQVADEGHQVGPFGLNGYKGIMTGGSFVGVREDSRYAQFSGAYAERFYRRLRHADLSVSRLDLAVTVKFRTMPSQLGEDAYSSAVEAVRSPQTSNRGRKVWYMSGLDGGYTLYIGSPSSSQRGRVYNKEIQSETPEYANCWRYEVVLRNALADQQFDSLVAVHEVYAPLLVSAVVKEWYGVRGVAIPISNDETPVILPVNKKAPSDAAKKLAWLEKQVKPAVKWLLEAGYATETMVALGLPHDA